MCVDAEHSSRVLRFSRDHVLGSHKNVWKRNARILESSLCIFTGGGSANTPSGRRQATERFNLRSVNLSILTKPVNVHTSIKIRSSPLILTIPGRPSFVEDVTIASSKRCASL